VTGDVTAAMENWPMQKDDGPKKLPELTLIEGVPTADQLLRLYTHLTGKEPTPEQVEELRVAMEKDADQEQR
jgi:hypothetical protein